MAKTKITAPVAQPGEVTGVGGLVFTDGVAETDNEAIIAYCRSAGYGIGKDKPRVGQPDEWPDSREVHAKSPERVGGRARDAAVDPQPEDYLAPVNAGKADPHGPAVVAPEVHGSGTGVLAPGAVTEAKETQAAAEGRVEGKSAMQVAAGLAGDNTGPLNLSDPSSGEHADTGRAPVEGEQPARKTAAKKTAAPRR